MPYIIVSSVTADYKISLSSLASLYPAYFKFCFNRVNILLYKVFNDERKLYLDVMKKYVLHMGGSFPKCYIDVEDICMEHSIPVGYFLVFDVISVEVDSKIYPILPHDFKIECYDSEIRKIIENEMTAFSKIREIYEVPDLLSNVGLNEISRDLTEGLKRFDDKDYEGSVKFFRKACEGLKIYLEKAQRVDGLEKRADELKRFSKSAYSLISNFGEHYKTSGGPEEAILARNLVLSLSRYLAEKLASKRIIIKKETTTTEQY
ncbi:MAG: hypothetical protein ACTSYM_06585 [Candidatus Baldrarchaeia archaeon]